MPLYEVVRGFSSGNLEKKDEFLSHPSVMLLFTTLHFVCFLCALYCIFVHLSLGDKKTHTRREKEMHLLVEGLGV